MTTARHRYASMRSLLEVPILNEKFWAKVPTAESDAIMLDLEDSTTPVNKPVARTRIIEALGDPAYFGGRHVIVRVNNLSTQWGRDDLAALAAADGDFLISYPKTETGEEIDEVRSVMEQAGVVRGMHVMIETAKSVLRLDDIASKEGVVGLHFGYVDYAADVGSRPFNDAGDDLYAPATQYARSKIAIAAAAHGLFCTGGTLIPEYRDLEKVRSFVRSWSDIGYTACIAVSPKHLPIINDALTPTDDEITRALAVCEAYEAAVSNGDPAAVLDGRVITLPDHRVASLVLARAGRTAPVSA
ncbi:HpcH/HpaI aldolase/citrate lyase family protein [Rhodococcoides kyotonense]|uniref:Citrate lyase subunit beta / citryl-CoA lyase n=1 Tax=Rhodococcoides kyotonense TaxID=398843 RepID=A0A239M018_9NOCA|nr:CoA ester lyase [Rhodococcus kyotonensis]SNT36031.1 citrate lyase subunit beta / citryl-CoA lyase [Rhodococcus kyotonensis]